MSHDLVVELWSCDQINVLLIFFFILGSYVEPEPKQLPLGVCIDNLTKVGITDKTGNLL